MKSRDTRVIVVALMSSVWGAASCRAPATPPDDFMKKQVYAQTADGGVEDPQISIEQIMDLNASSPARSSSEWTQVEKNAWQLRSRGTDKVSGRSVETIMVFSASGTRPPRPNSVELTHLEVDGAELPKDRRATMVKTLGKVIRSP
jgi:hypothetical protein